MKGTSVLYIDPSGKEHTFLVTALNGLNEGFISGVYVDMTAPEPDNLKSVYDIPHMSHESRQETNPDLPRYVVHCWKEKGESHLALPADHPQFDHPGEPRTGEHGQQIVKERPLHEANIAARQAENREPDVATQLDNAGPAPQEPQPPEPPATDAA
jgi:hypothetical protein